MGTLTLTASAGKKANIDFLRLSPYFAGLDDCVLEKISRLMVIKRVEKHEIIWLEQEPSRMIYFVASGLIKLFKTSSGGKEQILRLARPLDCFGHAGALNGGSNPESAQAVVPSVLYGLARNDLEVLLVEHQQLSRNTIKLLATEMHHYMSLVEDLSLRCVSGRLAKMLLSINKRGVCDTSLLLTRADMAAMAGTVREVIGKSLKALEDKGVIRYDRRKIIIRDREALKTMVRSV
ncbi:MAG TPA: Crp/Fnr family transcriptional regulator [Dehalococcoidales bacterium]|nr:Crp/Fnr family transcriptional regulator [Dehalococcoidales bacterium]